MIKESFANRCVEDVGHRGLIVMVHGASLRMRLFIARAAQVFMFLLPSLLSLEITILSPLAPLQKPAHPWTSHLPSGVEVAQSHRHARTLSHGSALAQTRSQVSLAYTSLINHHTLCKRRGLLLPLPKCVAKPRPHACSIEFGDAHNYIIQKCLADNQMWC